MVKRPAAAPAAKAPRGPSVHPLQLRKIQLTGGSSYTVTLPKEWVEKAELAAGDVVGFVAQNDGSLAVYPGARREAPAVRYEVELSHEDAERAFRKIVAAYIAGFDVIVVRSKKPLSGELKRAVRQATRRIIGIEVVEEDAHSVVLQDFLDPREFHIEKGLRRMEALTRAMQEDAVRAFHEDLDDLEDLFTERDDEVDRLYWMVNKQYHGVMRDPAYAQRMNVSMAQALNFLLVARLTERTADHAYRLAESLQALRAGEHHDKLDAKIEKQARRAIQLFSEAVTAFHRADAEAANKLIGEAKAFRQTQENVIKDALRLGGESILHVAYALESISRTAAYAADVAETAINHKVALGP